MREFKEINLTDTHEIVNLLSENGYLHNSYYHYTNLASIVGMAKSRKFHISSGDRMNDGNEIQKGSQEIWKRIYIGSFNYGANENMGLWGLYSIPWADGVRLEIPNKAMNQWVDMIRKSGRLYHVHWDSDTKAYRYTPLNVHFDIDLVDVVYIEREKAGYKLLCGSDRGKIDQRIDRESEMTGYIKNSVWAYEQEVRIRVYTYETHPYKQLAIDFPDEIFSQCTIWGCPWFSGDIQSRMEDEILFPFKGERFSSFSRLADKMKTACDMCKHERFSPKE